MSKYYSINAVIDMNYKPLLYQTYDILFQECPPEVSLGIFISGCDHYCKGCHSQHLWNYEGENLLDNLQSLLDLYKCYCTCVIFMGGDQNKKELIEAIKICKNNNLKTCLYTGNNYLDPVLCIHLDYIKIGEFKEELGGLNKSSTNQRLYKINHFPSNKQKNYIQFEEIKLYQ